VAEEVTTVVEKHSVDQAESAWVEEDVTMVQNLAASVARVAIVHDMALVEASALSPPSLDAIRFAGDQHLADDVLREFDPAFCLSELSSSCASLMAGRGQLGPDGNTDGSR
jgi:hypothetical protein